MHAQQALGKNKFLVDGFPRNLNNKEGWERVVGDKANIQGVLFYNTTEQCVTARILERGKTSGRADDNIESMVKRLRTYNTETYPIIKAFEAEGIKVFEIDATPSKEEVWATTQAAVLEVEGGSNKFLYGIGAVAATGALVGGYLHFKPSAATLEK